MNYKVLLTIALGSIMMVSLGLTSPKPDFSGSWAMDRARSFGMPGNMNQTMEVKQTGDQIEVETKLMQPQNERTVKDTFVLDGKEREFTPQVAAGQPPAKGKRTANWLPAGNGIVVNDVTTTETAKGPVTGQLTRKWTLTNDGELTIDMYIDDQRGSFESKRVFVKK